MDMMPFYPYGEKWRTHRRLFHQYYNMNAVTEFEPHETKATHEFMYRLVHAPDDFVDHIRLFGTRCSSHSFHADFHWL
jgi:hypothetical protein